MTSPRRAGLRGAATLFVAGTIGVVAVAPTAMTLVRQQLASAGQPVPPAPLLAVLSVAQPLLLLAIASVAGAALAPRLGLRSRIAAWPSAGRDAWAAFGRELPEAIGAGIAAAASIAIVDLVTRDVISDNSSPAVLAPRDVTAVAVGVLYGGITEEVLMRWGIMTVLAWLAHRISGGSRESARPIVMWAAIVAASVLFGVGHLPALALSGVPLTISTVARIIALNAIGGLFFGWLFWRRSLEAAMAAHAMVHVTWAIASASLR